MPKYEEVNLTIEKKGEKNGKFWIKGSDGEFYGGFCEWEGKSTDAYDEYTDVEEGQNVVITFSKSVGAGDKIYRNVRSINSSTQKPKVNPLYDQPKEFKPRNFDQEAYEKCCSLWTSSLLQKPNVTIKDCIALVETGMCWELFQAIKADGKKRFFEFSEPAGNPNLTTPFTSDGNTKPEELPTIQVQEPLIDACGNCGQRGANEGDGMHDCIPFK